MSVYPSLLPVQIAGAVLMLGGAVLSECRRKATNGSKGYTFVYPSRGHYAENTLDKSRLSMKYDYFKFPGGGIENGESPVEAMIRETREESGLIVKPDTVKEYGYVHRIQRSDRDETECFIQDNYYYLCETADEISLQELDDYEAKEAFTLEYVEPDVAIRRNRHVDVVQDPYDQMMFEREARVLELLIAEGLFEG